MSDAMMMTATESQTATATLTSQMEVDFAKCECCGLTEECTLAYIERIRERHQGKWICGLCAEAVKDEIVRCESERLISTEEALTKHINFCNKFSSSGPPSNPAVHLITVMRHILRRSLDSRRSLKSVPSSPTKNIREIKRTVLARSESCSPTLSLVNDSSYHTAKEATE
ncbi:unnamed protein product [Ilex paraguariensis]